MRADFDDTLAKVSALHLEDLPKKIAAAKQKRDLELHKTQDQAQLYYIQAYHNKVIAELELHEALLQANFDLHLSADADNPSVLALLLNAVVLQHLGEREMKRRSFYFTAW